MLEVIIRTTKWLVWFACCSTLVRLYNYVCVCALWVLYTSKERFVINNLSQFVSMKILCQNVKHGHTTKWNNVNGLPQFTVLYEVTFRPYGS